jgi:hypothetical protein
MARSSKLPYRIQQRIGDNVALGLPYALATESTGIMYPTFNNGIKKGKSQNLRSIFISIDILANIMLKGL